MNSVFTQDFWRRCSSCKTPIAYQATHFVCSVSTCTRKRIGYVFCTVHCWERHLPGARHRDAAAIEAKAPTLSQWKAELEAAGELGDVSTHATPTTASSSSPAANAETRTPQRVIARLLTSQSQQSSPNSRPLSAKDPLEQEVLVVVSKLKGYIRARSEMNTSDSVIELLSNRLRRLCDKAIDTARTEGRKTVMDRDFD